MDRKRVMIVGASGFVGGALKCRLEKDETVQLFTPSSKEMDALDYGMVCSYIRQNDIQYVFHAAANHAGAGTGIEKSLFFLETNLIMNYNLVKASYENNIEKFITFGTSCCYSDKAKIVMDEGDYWRYRSENTYGTSKRVMLEHLQNQKRMDWVYLVPPNLYGPGDHFGEKDVHFVPATVMKFDQAISSGDSHITVWGDGNQTRDFVYIDDLVDILIECMVDDLLDGQVVNISTAKETSIREIVLLIRKYMGCGQIEVQWDTSKPTGIARKVLENRRFLSIWPNYRFTSITEGIARTINWHLGGVCR